MIEYALNYCPAMARPKSEDKRNAILAAAIQVIAEQGATAPTAKIAQRAGVAEGTLFTYFSTKDELFNQLYLEIKTEMHEAMLSTYPRDAALKERARHIFCGYVAWGVRHPAKRKTIAQLGVSERVTAESRAQGMRMFAEFSALLDESIGAGSLRDLPQQFVSSIMAALADTTMEFVGREPEQSQRYTESGFEAFWNAITH